MKTVLQILPTVNSKRTQYLKFIYSRERIGPLAFLGRDSLNWVNEPNIRTLKANLILFYLRVSNAKMARLAVLCVLVRRVYRRINCLRFPNT